MDEAHHILVGAFSLSDDNDKVSGKGAQIHEEEDDFSYHEVSPVLLLSQRHHFNKFLFCNGFSIEYLALHYLTNKQVQLYKPLLPFVCA
jgi:hypothetical protein